MTSTTKNTNSIPVPLFHPGKWSDGGTFENGHIADATKDEKRGSGWAQPLLLRNKKPQWKPKTRYRIEGRTYFTDVKHCRVIQVDGRLRSGKADRHGSQQTAVGKLVYPTGDVGGHLIACRFSGSGHAINMVPMNSKVNGSGGKWGKMEKRWANWIKQRMKVVVSIRLNYTDRTMRPSSFDVTATATSNTCTIKNTQHIDNPVP